MLDKADVWCVIVVEGFSVQMHTMQDRFHTGAYL
jgi:hypothetical protein